MLNFCFFNRRSNSLGNRSVGNQRRVDDYYRRRGEILAGQNTGGRPTPPPSTSRFGGIMKSGAKVMGGSMLMSLPFAAMDIYSAKSHSAETLAEADEAVAYHKQRLEEIKSQEGVTQEQIKAQQEEIKAAEAFRQRTVEMNEKVERQANFKAAGTVIGTAIGSFGGPLGMIAGGVIGDILGSKVADWYESRKTAEKENGGKNLNATRQSDGVQKNISAKNDFDSKVNEINRKGIDSGLKSIKDFFGSLFKIEKSPAQQGTDYQKNFQQVTPQSYTPLQNNITPQNITPPTLPKFELPKLNLGARIKNDFDFVSNTVSAKVDGIKTLIAGMFTGFELPNIGEFFKNLELPEFNFGEKIEGIKTSLSGLFTNFELPNIGEFFSNFDISSAFPPLGISQWLTEQFAELAGIDLTSILPDFSSIGTTITEQFSGIPETISTITTSIGEGFSQIPTAASEAFATISTAASEGLTTIQTAWGALPSFFGGLFAGLGGVASGAGAAIAAGINSGIGMIQSAWEGLSGWLSSKIASLSAMASNAAAIGIGGVGHNAKGTSNFAGGWSEINESGGELILLPSGAKIYPHSTTKNILQHEIKDNFLQSAMQFPMTSNILSDGGKMQKMTEDIIRQKINSRERVSNILNGLRKAAVLNQNPLENLKNILGGDEKNSFLSAFNESQKFFSDISKLQEKKFDSLGNIEGLEIPEFNRITADDDLMVAAAKKQAQLEQLNSLQSPFNFDFDSLEIPSFDIPKTAESNTTTNNSPTNNFNFGGVNISNGANFDEFVHRLQELFTGAVNNSELV